MAAYRCFTLRKAQKTPTMHIFDSPIDALTCGVDYLKKGYQVRLGEECIAALELLQIPRKGKGNVQRNSR